jgi:hypothetical protein
MARRGGFFSVLGLLAMAQAAQACDDSTECTVVAAPEAAATSSATIPAEPTAAATFIPSASVSAAGSGAIARAAQRPLRADQNADANVEVRTLTVAPGQFNRTPAMDAAGSRRLEPNTARDLDVRLWLRRGSASVGAGLSSELVLAAPANVMPRNGMGAAEGESLTAGARALIVGVRYSLTDSSRLYVDRVGASTELNGLPPIGRDGTVRVGLEFKSAKSNFAGLKQGSLFRIQLNSDSNLSIRPRRGGLAFTLRSQW